MATYYVDPVSGNDSNSGSLASPWLTLARAANTGASPAIVAGDTVYLRNGTHSLSATVTFTVAINLLAYPGETPVISGSYVLSLSQGTGATFTLKGITFGAGQGSTAFKLSCGATNAKTFIENCTFEETTISENTKVAINGGSNSIIIKNCNFEATTVTGTNPGVISLASAPMIYMDNCFIKNFGKNVFQDPSSTRSVIVMKNTIAKDMINLLRISADIDVLLFNESYNNFDNVTNMIANTGSSSFNLNDTIHSFRSYHGFTKYINNESSGVITVDSDYADYNICLASTDQTDFTQNNLTTIANVAAAEFYDESADDYRIEITSPLADNSGDTVGAFVPDFDAFWSDVPEAKVESGYAYRVRSRTNNKTGSLSGGGYPLLSAGDVKIGVDRGDATLGTYDGSDRWTDPGITNVRSGTAYKANSTTNNRTGSAVIPVASDVRFGTNVDATTGTCKVPTAANTKIGVDVDVSDVGTYDGSDRWTDPGVGNVRSGTAYKANSTTNNRTGTTVVPAQTDVRQGVSVDNSGTGSVVVPSEANTKIGISVDVSGTGTYDGSDRWTDPGIANVRSATAYKANSTTNNRTGTCEVPDASDVRLGVSIDATTGLINVPDEADVRDGVAVDQSMGTCEVPDPSDVRTGIPVDATAGSCEVPASTDVRNGVAVDATTGSLVVPLANQVKIGVNFDNSSTGTYVAAERYSDPGISNVFNGVNYKFNSETNNRTGTLSGSGYPLLATQNVRIGVDRGDGALGTFKGSLSSKIIDAIIAGRNFP